MAKVWDEKQKRYVWDNSSSSNTVKATSSNWNDSKKNTYTNYTGYATPTKNVANTGKWDTSYVQQSAYWREWSNWDYASDVNQNKNRWAQIKANLEKDAVSNPKLFTNRADFEDYYHYNERHPSQQNLLNQAWDTYSKYWLNSEENLRADKASEVADNKNQLKIKNAATKYSKLLPAVNAIVNKLQDRLWPVFANLQAYQTKYLNDMSELRKLQNDYYAGMKREYDALAAGQSASVGSTLSGQWLSQSAIASTVDWVDKNWQSRYNDLMWKHIETLKWLQDSEQNFMTTYGNLMWNLSNLENQAMQTWYNSFKDLEDHMESTYNTSLDEKYKPYEVLTQGKVSGSTETATSAGKTSNKQATYQWADNTTKKSIVYNQVYWLLADDPTTFAKASQYIADAVAKNPNDWEAAVSAVLAKVWVNNNTPSKSVVNVNNDVPITVDPKKFNTWEDYKKAWWTYPEKAWEFLKGRK